MKPSADQINYLNMALMVAACAAVFLAPFEVFLLAYAILGPLHYLTEISWIHDRGYFLARPGKPRLIAWLSLVGLALAAMMVGLVAEKILHVDLPPVLEIGLFYLVFAAAGLLAFGVDRTIGGIALAFIALGIALFSASPWYGVVAFLIITIVHVLVFTAGFILFGALKSKSVSGLASLGVFAACIVAVLVITPAAHPASAFVQTTYQPFRTLNDELLRLVGLGFSDIYDSAAGQGVMRLIAFAYTYHYLNWFSKTSVIGWHQISKARAAVILMLWLAAVATYAVNYELGFIVLYSLSVLHVMFEFPLNHQTFAGIGRELYGLMPRRPAAAKAVPAASPTHRRKRRRS